MRGLGGNDELRGMDGDDYLSGGPGDDLLMGGKGDDSKNAQQQRIEDGINVIRAHLGHPDASVPSVPQNAVTGAKGRGIEALIPTKPAPAGKKSSAKRSA